jgi:hypothetical protein
MDLLEKLMAIEEIKQLKARYFRFVDTKHWDGLRDLFADDVVFDTGNNQGVRLGSGDPIQRGADTLVAFIRAAVSGPVAIHHGHMPEIEILSDSTARGIWALEDRLYWPAGGDREAFHGFGHYHETYEKSGGAWRIKTMRAERLRMEVR